MATFMHFFMSVDNGRLCLHFPGEWDPRMLISETIIPWASEWLYFHELWLATGEWHGGGHNPSPKAPETLSKSEEQGVDTKHHAMYVLRSPTLPKSQIN